jgi:hypothetical protein
MSSYSEALKEFYNGEVGGEALYSAALGFARNQDERLKWSTLLQLETETKAWLRAPMIAHGVSIEEQAAEREKAVALAQMFKQLPWSDKMQKMREVLNTEIVPLYQSHVDAARERGKDDEVAVCSYMVEHEKAQVEFARRELAGASLEESLEPVVKFLKYPIRR